MATETNRSGDRSDSHPGHFLMEWREYMGWTQEELAEMAFVDQSKITRLENGKRGLKADFLHKLAKIFAVPASALIDTDPSTPDGAQTAEMLRAWNSLTPDKRSDMLKMIRALAPRAPKADAS